MEAARNLINFIDKSPTPFHAVQNVSKMLEAVGFKKIRESESWGNSYLQRGGKYYFTRNQSTLFAFVVPKAFTPGNGFNIVATHTDSPCLKVCSSPQNEVILIFLYLSYEMKMNFYKY